MTQERRPDNLSSTLVETVQRMYAVIPSVTFAARQLLLLLVRRTLRLIHQEEKLINEKHCFLSKVAHGSTSKE